MRWMPTCLITIIGKRFEGKLTEVGWGTILLTKTKSSGKTREIQQECLAE